MRVLLKGCWHVMQVRVLWQGRDPEWDELDGGAFAQWLQSCEDELQRQKALEGRNGFSSSTALQVLHFAS